MNVNGDRILAYQSKKKSRSDIMLEESVHCCNEAYCENIATYELEWQEEGGRFASIKVCDEHFPTNPDVVQCFCSIRKIKVQ